MLGKLADDETLDDDVKIEEKQDLHNSNTISAMEMKIKDLQARNTDLEQR